MFKGSVRLTTDCAELKKRDTTFALVVEAFKHYWQEGFHPDVGRDVITSKPNPPEGHRHAHIVPLSVDMGSSGSPRSSKKSWLFWQSSTASDEDFTAADSNTNKIPTSNRLLFYFVDVNRNAYIFMYRPNDGHEYMNTHEFSALVEGLDAVFEKNNIDLMSIKEQHSIWSDDWWIE